MSMDNIQDLFTQLRDFAAANPSLLQKDTTGFWGMPASATTGINYYDLELGAKTLVPIITPLRNKIPRTSGKGGIQANWRGIVGLNATAVGGAIADGIRNAVVQTTTRDFTAAYKQTGLEDNVTFGADLAAQGFDDLKALSVRNLLWAVMIEEELLTLGGLGTVALASITPTPSLAASAAATLAATATGIINASVATVTGAIAYAWFWATGAGTGGEILGAITTLPYYSITAAATGTQTVLGASGQIPGNSASVAFDSSQNPNAFDGLLTMCALSTYQPNVTILGSTAAPGPWTMLGTAAVNGTTGVYGISTLTADNLGGIIEIDAVLKWFWDVYRLSPTDMYISSQEQTNISKKIAAGPSSGSSNARFVFNVEQGVMAGGYMVKSYLNKYTMSGAKDIPIHLHPNMPAGTILFYTDVLPYPLSNVSNVLQYRVLRDYYQIEWPLRTRKYEYGVYLHSVLQNFFPPAFSVLSGIGNG